MPENAKLKVNPKVVHLEPESQRITRSRIARLPAPVHAVHEKAKHLLLQQLKVFFDKADDSLFELADKAHSNQEQNLYFDSMREVRVQRMSIEKRFSDAIDTAFSALIVSDPNQERSVYDETLSADALSLVQNEDLEEMVALDSSVAKANRELGEQIQQISLRIDSLVPVKVYQKNNPIGPDVLCSAFMDQIKRLDVGIKAKLVLFKLFDNSVIGGLKEIYRAVNQTLVEHNVLPSLSHSAGRVQTNPRNIPNTGNIAAPPASQVSTGQVPVDNLDVAQDVSPEVLVALQSILNQQPTGHGQAISPELGVVMHMLSSAQRSQQVSQGEIARVNVRNLLVEMQQQQGISAKIGRVDDEVINLVNMLFDFILEDRNLATPMKALISRMQIPIVKVALVDKSFFTKGGHIARRLLNEMATAAIGWQGELNGKGKDPLYRKMEEIVRKLINEFDTNVGIFSELLVDFTEFLEKEKRRIAVLERRTVDAEDGKARAEVARTTVSLEIELRTVDQQLPEVVNKMITDVWSNVMFVIGLKHGYESDNWKESITTLEELVWSVRMPTSNEERHKLIRLVPSLLKKLRAGFDIISYNPFEMSELFKALEEVHLGTIRGKSFEPANLVEKPKPVEKAKQKVKTQESDANIGELKSKENSSSLNDELDELEKALGLKPSSEKVSPKAASAEGASERMDTIADGDNESGKLLPENDPHMLQVKQFVQGAWFDFNNEDSSTSRCRLAAFIKPTGKYIFVNRNGMKVAEKSQQELAEALKSDNLKALDNSMLFDRALETVVTSLRKN